jgi:hypothetical protein
MRHRIQAIDFGIAAVLAALVLIVSPGVAVAGMIAVVIMIVCGVSVVLEGRRRRPARVSRPRRGRRA